MEKISTNTLGVFNGIVAVYKHVWEDVNRQFSDLPSEKRFEVYKQVCQSIHSILETSFDEARYNTDEEDDEDSNQEKITK